MLSLIGDTTRSLAFQLHQVSSGIWSKCASGRLGFISAGADENMIILTRYYSQVLRLNSKQRENVRLHKEGPPADCGGCGGRFFTPADPVLMSCDVMLRGKLRYYLLVIFIALHIKRWAIM